jgi:hypothetical protein
MNKKKIIIFTIIICVLCLLFNKKLQYFLISFIFSNIAPTSKNDIDKRNMSDKLFDIKYNLDNEIKLEILEPNIKKMNTVEYKSIKNMLNKDYFKKITDDYTQPFLIKNVFNENSLEKYNFAQMKKDFGNMMIECLDMSKDKDMDTKRISFSEYVDQINSGKKYYLTVNNSIANAFDKVLFENFLKQILNEFGLFNAFIGNKDSYTSLHSELTGSCAFHLNGSKRWYIVEPKYSNYLNTVPDKDGMFSAALFNFNNKSRKYIEHVPRYEIICEKGDFLYVPPWYWHEVHNLTDETIMTSFRPAFFKTPYKTNLGYTLMGLKNSLAYNNVIYPNLLKYNIRDKNYDRVVTSIKEIKYRIPEKFIF